VLKRFIEVHQGMSVKRDWTTTQEGFRQFLSWLDEGVASGGEKYIEMRRRLALYFDRKNCPAPDELADETLNRVASKLQEKGAITNLSPAHYCYIVAKFVFLEYLRRTEHEPVSFAQLPASSHLADGSAFPRATASSEGTEELVDSLEHCLNRLESTDRELILEYYRGDGRVKIESRRRLAERMGLSSNALSIRACRIRNKVEECVKKHTTEQ
jgi:DNA-directed RNA polymerase specialized sigma24 family protein